MRQARWILQVLFAGAILADGVAKLSNNVPATPALPWLLVSPDVLAPWFGVLGLAEAAAGVGLLAAATTVVRPGTLTTLVFGAAMPTVLSGGYLAMAPSLDLLVDAALLASALLLAFGTVRRPAAGPRLSDLPRRFRHRHAT